MAATISAHSCRLLAVNSSFGSKRHSNSLFQSSVGCMKAESFAQSSSNSPRVSSETSFCANASAHSRRSLLLLPTFDLAASNSLGERRTRSNSENQLVTRFDDCLVFVASRRVFDCNVMHTV